MPNENNGLNKAKQEKNDEFYTQLTDIEKEMKHYRNHFKNKVVYCNCDDPYISAFFEYFSKNFEFLKLKKLITTCYKSQQVKQFSQNDSAQAIKLEYTGGAANSLPGPDDIGVTHLKGDGDFRSPECIALLREADIVVTNPPFSLFREYVSQLVQARKKFIIVGNQNAISYKQVFPLIKNNELWLGIKNGDMRFKVPDYYEPRKTRYWQDEDGQKWRSLGNMCWYTNLKHKNRNEQLILVKQYSGNEITYQFPRKASPNRAVIQAVSPQD
ncbi:adenine-specific methyltransferase EcoRI family protein [Endozoicomonas sp. 4G]|uniref:adenine-specific methyltransferase EcoRI family protein n=1 Tax=Endozoicomonas sp. 4G TaxID=2872754 RepID=UPI0020785C40|nr:adenine-specific methyltransferase EcoRI family protein [Endozoicomonas sp. 4G]